MNNYEALFLIDCKLDEKATNAIFDQIKDPITKNDGNVVSSHVWAEKRRLCFSVKKHAEATYYYVNFKLGPNLIDKIKQAYRLNENVIRVLITRLEEEPVQPSRQEKVFHKK